MKLGILLKMLLGFAALSLGIIGLLLPVWPTTPFVLVAVGCFSTMPKLQKRILSLPFVQEYHESYTRKKGLCVSTVVVSLLFLWGMLLLSAVLVKTPLVIAILAVIGSLVSLHIFWMARLWKRGEKTSEEKWQE